MGDTNHDHDDIDDAVDTDDVDTDVDETEDEPDTSKNTDGDDDADDDSADDADDDDASEDGDDDDGEGDSDKSSDTADDDDSDADDDVDDGEEPELRKPKAGAPNSEWAAYRKQQKAKAQKSGDDKDSDDKDDDGEDTDEDLSPEDAAAIDKRIAKALSPFQKQQAEQEVEASIATFLKDNPDFAPYAAKVKRFANHPARASVPVKAIFYEVAGDKLMAIGAKRAKAADAKAKKTKTAGSNANAAKGSKDYANMPLDDFGKELEDIKTNGSRA